MPARHIFVSLLLATISQGALADEPSQPKTLAPATIATNVNVGDEWDYKLVSNLQGHNSAKMSYVVEDVSEGKIEGKLRTQGSGGNDSMILVAYDPYWRMIEGPRGKVVGAGSKDDAFPDVAVGKEWTAEKFWQPGNSNIRFKWTEHGHVAAWETVTLADGKSYDAFRITYRRESTPNEGTGIQLVQSGLTTHKLVEHEVLWYAPAVNRYVKRTFEYSRDGTISQSFSEELTAYKRGG